MTHLKKYFHNRKKLMGYSQQNQNQQEIVDRSQTPFIPPVDTLTGLEKFKLCYGENWRMIYYGELNQKELSKQYYEEDMLK